MKKVFIAEPIPSDNKGEAALMYGIQKTITTAYPSGVLFYLCSWTPEKDQKAYGENVKVLRNSGLTGMQGGGIRKKILFSLRLASHVLFLFCNRVFGQRVRVLFRNELWTAYVASDVILVGHDNSFSPYHLFLIWFCLALQKKIAIYGTTVMPSILNNFILRKWAKSLLNRVSLITTREEITYKYLKTEIMIDRVPLYCTADKAFILESTGPARALDIIHEEGIPQTNQPLVGIMMVNKSSNVFRAAFQGEEFSEEEKYERHALEIAKALDMIGQQINCFFIFLPHSIGPSKDADDRLVARSIVEQMREGKRVIELQKDISARDLKALMGKFDMTITERTHGGIASATMQTPTLWITHTNDWRTYGIVGKTLKMPDCLYNIEKLDGTALAEKVFWLWNNRAEVKSRLEKNTIAAEQLAMKNGYYFKTLLLDE